MCHALSDLRGRIKDNNNVETSQWGVSTITVFGNIEKGEMRRSSIGDIAQQCWLEIPKHYSNIELDEFIVMPNHIHGIIVINKNNDHQCRYRRDEAMPRLYNACGRKYAGKSPQMSKISPKPNSLSSIIGSYKSVCTKQICQLYNPNFQWQSRFYDHIIRNDESLNKIREYIRNNPLQWEFDRDNNIVETRLIASLQKKSG